MSWTLEKNGAPKKGIEQWRIAKDGFSYGGGHISNAIMKAIYWDNNNGLKTTEISSNWMQATDLEYALFADGFKKVSYGSHKMQQPDAHYFQRWTKITDRRETLSIMVYWSGSGTYRTLYVTLRQPPQV